MNIEILKSAMEGNLPPKMGEAPYEADFIRLYGEEVMKKGLALLDEAIVPVFLDQISFCAIKLGFPDVKPTGPNLVSDRGVVSLGIEWNFRHEERDGVRYIKYNALNIAGRISTREIVVSDRDGGQLLTESEWSLGTPLENAIIYGFAKPLELSRVVRRAGVVGAAVQSRYELGK